jgi:sterol desaturase/sphingolipid hydroxylase (fatty acid hydroxylase superfamily)
VFELFNVKTALIVFLIFMPLERLLPAQQGRKYLRDGLATDLLHLFLTGILIRVGFLVVLVPVMVGIKFGVPNIVGEMVRAQPTWLQILEIIVISDIGFYVAHRLEHAVPFLWKFHAIHHSIEELDALAAHRVHPLDQLFVQSMSLLPVYALGFDVLPIVVTTVIYFWQSLLIHSNIRIGLGPLKWLVAGPLFHHWHHAHEPQAIDKNFAGQLSIIDALFGTMYMPDRLPAKYGTDEPVPDAYHRQLAYPFRRSGTASAIGAVHAKNEGSA